MGAQSDARSLPFESAASSLVDEGEHPVKQLDVLEDKAAEHEALGDTDAVIECRIKQLALQRLLTMDVWPRDERPQQQQLQHSYLYDFPIQGLVRAEINLAEAYAAGRYFKQADFHLAQADKIARGGVDEDTQCQRLQVDILIAQGVVHLAKDKYDAAIGSLEKARRLTREAFGEWDVRCARICLMMGEIAQQRGRYVDAIEHFQEAWEVREYVNGPEAEETVRLNLRMAEAQHLDGRVNEALDTQTQVVRILQGVGTPFESRAKQKQGVAFPELLVDASAQLARWLEASGKDAEALAMLQEAETTAAENLGNENSKAVAIKSDIALLHLKLGDHTTALQYLNDVHYFERCLHGSQSISVARTLKALGTVHMVRRNLGDAEQCLSQALRIFEGDHPPNHAIIRDIHAKLDSIASMSRSGA